MTCDFAVKRARLINCHDLFERKLFTRVSWLSTWTEETFALDSKKKLKNRIDEFKINYSMSIIEVSIGEIFKCFQLLRAGVIYHSKMLSDDFHCLPSVELFNFWQWFCFGFDSTVKKVRAIIPRLITALSIFKRTRWLRRPSQGFFFCVLCYSKSSLVSSRVKRTSSLWTRNYAKIIPLLNSI